MANPINVLCKLIADVTGPDGKIRIPGFYDDVEEASEEERKLVASIPFNEEEYKKSIGVKALFGEEGYSTIRAHRLSSIVRCMWNLGWIYWRWCQDGYSFKGIRKDFFTFSTSSRP